MKMFGILLAVAFTTHFTINGAIKKKDSVDVILCPKCDEYFDADNQSLKCPHGWMVRN